MVPVCAVGDNILQWMVKLDEAACALVATAGCAQCGGPLHRSDYPRKPRGGLFLDGGEAFSRRLSLCCGWQGCRRRATPPSVRFLGRRVYLGAAVILAGLASAALTSAREIRRATGIPARTVARWRLWWQTGFVHSRLFEEQRGRLWPPLEIAALPASLVERFALPTRESSVVLLHTLGFLSPLTTTSVRDGARFVRVE